jgi:hypothetical protein
MTGLVRLFFLGADAAAAAAAAACSLFALHGTTSFEPPLTC